MMGRLRVTNKSVQDLNYKYFNFCGHTSYRPLSQAVLYGPRRQDGLRLCTRLAILKSGLVRCQRFSRPETLRVSPSESLPFILVSRLPHRNAAAHTQALRSSPPPADPCVLQRTRQPGSSLPMVE